ncbi:tastin [Tachyglossus aculeatus]|uniref:tastin n=1 Tax=Tachyglossus aculeatus TaxID=9261 RepID=UPI0018F3CDA1|nr:tastin [Tachyglossus aculeatus]
MSLAQGVMETPARAAPLSHSKIPILSGSRHRCPDRGRRRADQENWNPQGSIPRKPPGAQLPVGTPPHPRLQQLLQTPGLEGPSSPRTPLEEIRPVSAGQNLGSGPPPKKEEVPGALEFVADPAALATILSGVGVSASGLGRQPSLAQRVLVRGSRGDVSRRVRGARASAYLAPRTPAQRFNLIRASCFSRLEGPGPRCRPVGSREPEAQPLGPRPHVILGPQKMSEQATVTSRALVGKDFGLPTAVAVAPGGDPGPLRGLSGSRVGLATLGLAQRVPVKGTWRAAPAAGRNATGKGDNPIPCRMPSVAPKMPSSPGRVILPAAQPLPLGLAQRMPAAHPPAQTSYSVRRLLAAFPKTPQATTPAPRAHQVPWPGDLSPPSCIRGSGCEEPAPPWEQIAVRLFDQESQAEQSEGPGDHPTAAPQEGEPPSPTPPAGGPGPQEQSRLQRIALLQQLLQEEVEGLSRAAGARGHNLLDKPEVSLPLAGALASVTPPLSGAPASMPPRESSSEPPSASPSRLQGAGFLCGKQGPSQQPAASTSLTFSSQRPICASPSIRSTRSPGPSGAAAGLSGQLPLALALRQRLARRRAAAQHFQEACLDEECAFYTGRSSLPGSPRLCKDPVATLLEWQEALGFVPISIPVPQGRS